MTRNDRAAVVLVVDGLSASALGPYGGPWAPTPTMNDLASEGLLWEFFLTDGPDPETFTLSCLSGRHALAQQRTCDLLQRLGEHGAPSELLSDDPAVVALADEAGFSTAEQWPEAAVREAASVEETQIGQLLGRVVERLQESSRPRLYWIHLRGMTGPWDAPRSLRESLVGEEDPPPPELIAAPRELLAESIDPDRRLGLIQALAGQVMAFDMSLASLLEWVDQQGAEAPLLLLTSPRGYPLGEHGVVGPEQAPPHGSLLHVPLLARWPDGPRGRRFDLAQPPDLWATLGSWLAGDSWPVLSEQAPGRGWSRSLADAVERSLAVAETAVAAAARAPTWFAWLPRDGALARLFAKPDDLWETNDVADRCPGVVERLREATERFRRAAEAGVRVEVEPEPGGSDNDA